MDALPAIALDCYRSAIRNVAFYAVELEKDVTAGYRRSLERLEATAAATACDDLPAAMREYRGKALAYVSRLCDELQQTADQLGQILDSLSDGDADCDNRMRSALARLRAFARTPDAAEIREPLLAAALMAQEGIEEMRRRQDSTVAQLMGEIRSLHKKIDSLESASSLDVLTTLLSRVEMEARLELAPKQARRLLVTASGLRLSDGRFDNQVAAQLAAAFLKRLYRVLPAESAVARWGEEEFLILLPPAAEPAALRGKQLEEQLSGSYGCSQEGKSVRPALQVKVEDYSLQPTTDS